MLIRSLTPEDRELLSDLFGRMSQAAIRHRYFGAKRTLTDAELAYLTTTSANHVALAATIASGGERFLGVGRYVVLPDRGSRIAEIAFEVGDAEQGRGIATLLLEHLATIARTTGVERFRAVVEADNDRMLEVFEGCGFAIKEHRDGGGREVELEFPVEDTAAFLGVSIERERQALARSMAPFFSPRSVAVIGASRDPASVGSAILDNLVHRGFRGALYVVHPQATEIAGQRCHRSLHELRSPVDLAVIAVPAAAVEQVVRDCAATGVRAVLVISAGFAECSAEGRAVQLRIRDLVRESGMRMIGPNCLGVLSTDHRVCLDATFSPVFPPAGNVSLVTQSGALGLAMIDYARDRGLGIADFASVGNKADVSGNDLLSYWSQEPRTKVIAMYLESFGNPRKFARLAPEVAATRPIVALKGGRSTVGARAAASHSAALATLDVGVDALFAQAGVIRAETLEEMFDVLALLSTQPVPRGNRVAVVTNAGGPGILFADACDGTGVELPAPSPTTREALRALLPAHAGLGNPIDMIASATPEQYARTLDLIGNDPEVDAVVAIYVPPFVTRPAEIAEAIARGASAIPADKPVAAVFLSSEPAPPELHRGSRGPLPVYRFPESVAFALAAAVRYASWKRRPPSRFRVLDRTREQAIRTRATRWLAAHPGGGWVDPETTANLLHDAGLPLVRQRIARADADAVATAAIAVGFPVVLKAIAPGLVHKSDVGGVAVGLDCEAVVRSAVAAMRDRLARRGLELTEVLVQRQVERGVEMLIGVHHDPSLGPLVVAGIGGTAVELYKDVVVRVTPVSDLAAAEMLDALKGRALLDGYRGAPPADRAALLDAITATSALVEVLPELVELDLNPVIVHRPGEGAICVDARMRLAAA